MHIEFETYKQIRMLQSALLKKAEDTEGDSAELSATKLRLQQQVSTALVVSDAKPNGASAVPLTRLSSAPRNIVRLLTGYNFICLIGIFFL